MKHSPASRLLVSNKRSFPALQRLVNLFKILKENWDSYEWPLVITIGVGSLFFGMAGFWQYNQERNISFTIWDCIYQALQLFSIQGSFDPNVPVPVMLEVSRFLSPAVAGYTFFQALKELFQEQVLLINLGQVQGHYIICGLGQKGMLLTRELKQNNKPVVVIEKEPSNSFIKACKDQKVLVITGDATKQTILEKAGVRRANHLIAVCGDDGTNAEIAQTVRSMAATVKMKGLTCTIHIVDNYLWTWFREREFNVEHNPRVMLEFFNVYDSGSRILLRETLDLSQLSQVQPHLLIIGMGELGENLVIHAAQKWCLSHQEMAQKLHISLIDPNIDRKLDVLKLKYPLLNQVCEITCYAVRSDSPYVRQQLQSNDRAKDIPITHAYVCMDDFSTGLQTGFSLLRLFQSQKVNIWVLMAEDTGLATFLREVKGPDQMSASLQAFGLLDRTCKVDLFDDGTHESLARAIHEAYLEQEQNRGLTVADNANLVPWEELSEEARESNRYQANHIGVKLNAISCGFMPWQDFGAEKFCFTPEEIEVMAEMEHNRWMQEKLSLGWKYGSQRNNEKRLHPDLVRWNEGLNTRAKEKTCEAVIMIPSLLARAGFQIYRIKNNDVSSLL